MMNLNSKLKTSPTSASELVARETPHYYEVKLNNHPNGVKQLHCGSLKDAESILTRYPGSSCEKIYLPHTPDTVTITAQNLGRENALNEGVKQLPESELEPLKL